MNDCTYCQNLRALTNAHGEEVPCPACSPRGTKPVNAKKAMRAAIAAVLACEECGDE